MKCRSCDCILTDAESVRKYDQTEVFIDLCDSCFSYIEDLIVAPEEEADSSQTIMEYENDSR